MASKIVAILPTRNSAWVLGLSVRALLMWVDEVVVLDHCPTDASDHICAALQVEYRGRFEALSDEDPTWHEMAQRQRLLETARQRGATHIVTIDDDELVSGNLLPTIRQTVLDMPPGRILTLPWLQLSGGIDQVITTGMWGQQNASCAFVDDPAWHWKVQAGGYDHHHRHPMGKPYQQYPAQIGMPGYSRTSGCLHLQMSSVKRLLWKHLHYKLTERLRWPEKGVAAVNAMYDRTVNECATGQDMPCPSEWWAPYSHLMRHLDIEAEPWQKAEALRMLAENPRLADGLTTYGLL